VTVSDFMLSLKNIITKFKWIFIPILLILTFFVILAIVNKSDNNITVEPDQFSLDSSALVKEYWEDNYFGSIKIKINNADVYIDGKLAKFDEKDLKPIINNNRIFLPVDLITNFLKTKAVYNDNNTAIIKKDDINVEITAGKNTI